MEMGIRKQSKIGLHRHRTLCLNKTGMANLSYENQLKGSQLKSSFSKLHKAIQEENLDRCKHFSFRKTVVPIK
jgi:hypothetical protein